MGYRSDVTDVTLLVSKKGFKALKEFIGRNNNDEDFIGHADMIDEKNNCVHIYWTDVKYCNDEDDIAKYEKGLENLEKMNLSYRLGITREDINDNEVTFYDGSDFEEINQESL